MLLFRRLPRALSHALLGALVATASLAAALPGRAAAPSTEQLQALEAALNSRGDAALAPLLEAGPDFDPAQLELRRRQLLQQFPNARWRLKQGKPLADGQATVNLKVVGSRQQGPTTYTLEGTQQLALRSNGQRINGQTVLLEQTILHSGDEALPVSLMIPDVVLTGQRYDVDVIFDDPLDGALTAGGIVALTPKQVASMESPSLELTPLAGGGIFKSVQAPFSPGAQTWAVLLVHPKGIITATKRVRVVSDRGSLKP